MEKPQSNLQWIFQGKLDRSIVIAPFSGGAYVSSMLRAINH